ncbi:hypothetical protein GJ744_002219 [Endocarpon pusillum]|uniref:Uncharacterized protein n=1 Tax=Endocarpon pusillum TaxID=364733 RepID=A0A8H7E0J7_9EURO|nr:hypothetical protein GJ744_002219 [Endocarpon pusillum]
MLGAEEGHAIRAANLCSGLAGLKAGGWDLGVGIEEGLMEAVEGRWTPDLWNLSMHVPVAGLAAGERFGKGERGGDEAPEAEESEAGIILY